ncbi:MAG: 16S rRNA (cytidine(1402)-2'-O)-methyltransferase [Firmicutes bacterium]|nr:16S rRNA (cytidine(1402)-2'-O)-methyltransferase [Bacillota bacterium]
MSDNANAPCLYVVATPIGNLEDMTPRAVRILGEVEIIAAEDTRHSRGLLSHFNIKTPMFSCHKFNEEKRGDFFMSVLEEGKSIALISDAGTPCISDPGHKLVSMAVKAGFPVVAVCGASAVVSALSVSGFDGSRFSFVGFIPRAKGDIIKSLAEVLPGTVVFYESPKRIWATLRIIAGEYPAAQVCLCNDLSKKFERLYHGGVNEVIEMLADNEYAQKGEYTCVVNVSEVPREEEGEELPGLESQLVDVMVKYNCRSLKEASAKLHEINRDVSKKEIYAAMLNLKEMFSA